jgi:competence protein ComEC
MTEAGQTLDTDIIEQSVVRHRPLVGAAVAFAVGIIAGRWLELSVWCGVAVGSVTLACFALLFKRLSDGLRNALVWTLIGAAGTTTWAMHMTPAARRADASLIRVLGRGRTLCAVTGELSGETTVKRLSPLIDTGDGEPREISTVRVIVDTIESNGRSVPAGGSVSIGVEGELTHVAHGDRVRAFGWITPLDPADPASRYDVSKGIEARMSVASPAAVHVLREHPGSFRRLLFAAKQHFRGLIEAYCPPEAATVMKTVLLGDRERMGRDLTGKFNRSGTTHVLAISGLHVGIIYAVMIGLCRLLMIERWPRRTIVLGVVIAYALTTGLRPATIRAMLMIVLFEVGDALSFSRNGLNTMAAAALIILACAPHQLFEAGFQLTFVAVTGIILFSPGIARALRRQPDELERLIDPRLKSPARRRLERGWRSVSATLAMCIAATLAVAPLQAYYFNIVTPVSIIATALLAPLVAALISLGFVFLAVASMVPAIAPVLAWLLSMVATAFTGVVGVAADLPFGHVFVAPPQPGWVVAFYGALLLVAAHKQWRVPAPAALVAPASILCAYLIVRASVAPGPEFAATFVDVGHGTAVIMTRGRQTMVYDCGSGTPWTTYDVGRGPVAARLWELGVKRIDVLMLSHSDADHVNGVLSLIERFPVGTIVLNKSFGNDKTGKALTEAFRRRGVISREAGNGDALMLGEMNVSFLWPPKGPSPWKLSAVNDRSLVARVTADGRSLLLTGDIEQVGMAGMLAQHDDVRAETLYVPHHGAPEPVLAEFIRAVKPDIAVISAAGYDRNDDVLDLLRGIPTFRTFEHGTLTLRASDEGWEITTRSGNRASVKVRQAPLP